jgi:hypothetical protein
MNIKENYYINNFNQLNKLIEEQKYIKENGKQNSTFDIIRRHQHSPTQVTGH